MLTTVIRFRIALHSLEHHFGRNRNLVIQHGLMGSCKNFRYIVKSPVFSSTFNSFLIDARNHGESPHTATHTIEDMTDDLYQYIITNDLLNPQKKLTLMGHSMGGLIMMEFTKRYYEREIQELIDRIIILDIPALPINTAEPEDLIGNMLKRMVKIDLSRPITQIHAEIDKRATGKDTAGLLKGDLIKQSDGTYKWRANLSVLAHQGFNNIVNYSLSYSNPKKWKKPIELIYGQLSPFFSEGQKKQYIRNYPQMGPENFHQVDKAGHWVHFQNTPHFLQICQKIFERDKLKSNSV